MTDEEKRQKEALRLREWRKRKRAEYLAENGGELPPRGRPRVSAEIQAEKKKLREEKYREQKRLEKPPKPPKPEKPPKDSKPKDKAKQKTKGRSKKAPPDPKEILPPEDAEWKAPEVCEILAASKDYEGVRRYCTIERRQHTSRPLRLKIVIFGNSVTDLKREARKIGIYNFQNFGNE